MASSGRRRKRDASKDVSEQLLLSFGLLESLLPVGGSELEQAIGRPRADEAEQIADVAVGLDVVEACAGEQRDEGHVCERAVIAADEEPVSTTEDLPAQIEFADVVVCGEAAVVEESPQRDALVASVSKRVLDRRLVEHVRKFGVTPLEKAIDDWATFVASDSLFVFSRRIRDGPLNPKKRANMRQADLGPLWI